jgi:poly(A) polymerase
MKSQALKIINILKDHGHQAVIAGGAVRDMLLGIEPNDWDISTSALPDEVEALFEKTIPAGKNFGVIIVVLDGFEIEVATFRSDSARSDGRRPDSVIFTSMKEDAKRRDLTVNGLFYDPSEDKIIDYVGGQKDIKDKVIRFIGDPDARITEDKLRLMRAVRFSARLDFEIVPETIEAIKRHTPEVAMVSPERLADELLKILRAGNFKRSFDLLFETKLIDYILPEVRAMGGCEQPPEFHPEGDVFIHSMIALENLPNDASDELLMATLLHDVGKPSTQTFEDRIRFNGHELAGKDISREILKRLKFSNDFTDHVLSLIENHMKFSRVKEMRISRLKRFMAMNKFEEHMALHRADCLSSYGLLDNYEFLLEKLKTFEPEEVKPQKVNLPPRLITGNDLLEMGFKQGPIFRTILTDVEDKQLEGTFASKEEALKYVARTYKV